MVSQASFAPHLEYFSRASLALRLPGPQAVTIAGPLSVPDAPQLPHSIFTLAPNLTRSAAASMCFVDIRSA